MKHAEFPLMLPMGVDTDDIKKELDKYSVNYGTVQCFSADLWGYLNTTGGSLAAIAAAVSPALCAWLKGRANRSIKITLKNGTTVEAKGMTPQQMAEHIKMAVQATLSEEDRA